MTNKAKLGLYALMTLLTVLIVALTVVPLPKLISYKQGQGIVKSVYWRGFGEFGQLLDSNAEFVKLDEHTQRLHICHRLSSGVQCQPFKVVSIQGPFATLPHL
jgi:hypothetical protein